MEIPTFLLPSFLRNEIHLIPELFFFLRLLKIVNKYGCRLRFKQITVIAYFDTSENYPSHQRFCLSPELCPLWLLFGTPSAIRPELASRYRQNTAYPICGRHCIYFWYTLLITYAVSLSILWPFRLVWLFVCCLYEVYLHIYKRVSFRLHGCCGDWEGWTCKLVNLTSWVAIVTPTNRPK